MFDASSASVRAAALLHATNEFLRSATAHELAGAVVRAASTLFGASQATVVFLTPTGDPRVFATTGNRPEGAGSREAEQRGGLLIDRALAGEELCTGDDGTPDAFAAHVRAYGGQSGLALPIRTSAGVSGVLMIVYETAASIDPRIRELARSLTAQAGLAIELLDARDDLARRTEASSALLAVSQRLATLTDPETVPAALVTAIHAATGASLAAVARWSEEESRVRFTAVHGMTAEEHALLRDLEPTAAGLGIVQGGLAGKSAVHVPPFDPAELPIPLMEALRITAIAGAPIAIDDRVWGFLMVATREGDPSIEETGPELLQGFATITSTAIGRTEAIAALERSREYLESAVAARTRELTQVVEELELAIDARTEFLSNVSHELRTPLTSILGFTDLLLHGLEGPLTDAQHEDLRTIEASGGRLLGLIDDLIDVSQIEAGTVELQVAPITLRAFLEDLAAEVRPLAARNGLTLEVAADDGPATIHADELRLRAVLANLLSNAIKFTPAGGTVRIETRPPMTDGIRIDVVDTGVGIAPEDHERVFEKFHRSAAPDIPGTGLGLAIAREYARLHGGDLLLESTTGAGSRFSVTLPLLAPSEQHR